MQQATSYAAPCVNCGSLAMVRCVACGLHCCLICSLPEYARICACGHNERLHGPPNYLKDESE